MEPCLTSPPGPSSLIFPPAQKLTWAQGCGAEGMGFSCCLSAVHGTADAELEERSGLNLLVMPHSERCFANIFP